MIVETTDIIGYTACFLTVINLIPQLIKIIKNKSSKNISVVSYTILSLGLILWAIYGFMKKDIVLIVTNCLSVFITILIIFSIFYFKEETETYDTIYTSL
jgi:MtN3 and saliva related transmembrane protein